MIDRFTGEYKSFSNFEVVSVVYDGLTYPTVEHAFVAAKTLNKKFRRDIALMPAHMAGLAKRRGRKVEVRPNWKKVKIDIMATLLLQKYAPKESTQRFHDLLLSTKNQILKEGNYWHDNFWGDCHCQDCKDIEGENHLGWLLMKIREYYALKKHGIEDVELVL